jgi:hypothetical protein
MAFEIGQNARRPVFVVVLKDDAAGGEVTYSWGTADTNTSGDFYAQVEIIWNDGKPETFPSGPGGTDDGTGYWPILIHPELD